MSLNQLMGGEGMKKIKEGTLKIGNMWACHIDGFCEHAQYKTDDKGISMCDRFHVSRADDRQLRLCGPCGGYALVTLPEPPQSSS